MLYYVFYLSGYVPLRLGLAKIHYNSHTGGGWVLFPYRGRGRVGHPEKGVGHHAHTNIYLKWYYPLKIGFDPHHRPRCYKQGQQILNVWE